MYNEFAKNQGLNLDSFPPEKKMGSPAESLEKKNIFLKKGDEIRRLDGTQFDRSRCYEMSQWTPPSDSWGSALVFVNS